MLFSALLVIAAVALAFSTAGRRVEEGAAPGETSRNVPNRETLRPVSRAALQPADVVKMTPEDWTARFREFPSEVSAENEQEILLLAEELEEILKQNPDPNGMEAMVFSEVILTLFEEGSHPE